MFSRLCVQSNVGKHPVIIIKLSFAFSLFLSAHMEAMDGVVIYSK